jgi:hypothetical protein
MPGVAETTYAFQGWTLRQAMERTVHPDVWRRCQAAFQCTEAPLRSGSSRQQSGAETGDSASVTTDNEATQQFRRIMADARHVAFGSPGKPNAIRRSIGPEAWKDSIIADLDNSVVQERTGRQTKLFDVVIYPLVHSPDAPLRLVGLSLVEAFRRCVLDDPEIGILAARAFAKENYKLESLREGQFPTLGVEYKWPLDLVENDLAHNIVGDFYVMVPGPPRPVPSDSDRALARTIIDRLGALRGHLKEGRVVGEGMYSNSGMTREIPPLQWARHDLSIDVHNGDLVEYEQQKPVVRWSGIMLSTAEKVHVKPTTTVRVRSSAIGHSRPAPKQKTTALNASIAQAVAALWPNGVSQAVRVQSRDEQIISWQKVNKIAVASSKAIYRFFKDRPSR